MSRTVAEWIHLPATIGEVPSVDTFKARLCNIKLLLILLILSEAKLLSYVRWSQNLYSYNRLSHIWRSDCITRQKQKCIYSFLYMNIYRQNLRKQK